MKSTVIFCMLIVCWSCATSKNKDASTTSKILYSKIHQELDGKLEIELISGNEIKCSANTIQVSCDSYADSTLRLSASNGKLTLKLLDEKSYYFTPYCNGKPVKLFVHLMENGEAKLLTKINVKVAK